MIPRLALPLTVLVASALSGGAAFAAPKSVTCLQVVQLRFDDSRYELRGEPPQADGACELALAATPASNYSLQVLSLQIQPKEAKKINKLKADQRLQLLADQMAQGGAASPMQDVEAAGQFTLGFSVSQSPSGALQARQMAVTQVGKALLYAVLNYQAERVPGAPAFDRAASRQELLSFLAGVQIGTPAKAKKPPR